MNNWETLLAALKERHTECLNRIEYLIHEFPEDGGWDAHVSSRKFLEALGRLPAIAEKLRLRPELANVVVWTTHAVIHLIVDAENPESAWRMYIHSPAENVFNVYREEEAYKSTLLGGGDADQATDVVINAIRRNEQGEK